MTRAQESCKATWNEFDLANNLWAIPAERMKMKRGQITPLTSHHLSVLDQTKRLNPKSRYVFPLTSHICLKTPRMAIQRFGIDSKTLCTHCSLYQIVGLVYRNLYFI